MPYSMTAFARQSTCGNWGNASWEIRSVNHRYLEQSWRLPESFRSLEPILRRHTTAILSRGKIDGQLKFYPKVNEDTALTVNTPLVKKLIKTQLYLHTLMEEALIDTPTKLQNTITTNAFDMLTWPGVLHSSNTVTEENQAAILDAFDATLLILTSMRKKEGDALGNILKSRLDLIKEEVNAISGLTSGLAEQQRNKLLHAFESLKIQIDPLRLEQEIVLLIRKSDITEELDRLNAHIQEVKHILQQDIPIGRRLDFLIQELNREANTIASKSTHDKITHHAVEIKVLIEQMREQVQNIE